jgi:hypothetical protein
MPIALVLIVLCFVRPASAQVIETREGSSNPMVEVFKSTCYGSLAGLLLGSALALATDDNDNDEEYVRWGFVGGTFFGFGYGIYHVASRPGPGQAMLQDDGSGWRAHFPAAELAVLAPAEESPPAPAAVALRVRVASLRF